MRAGDLNGGGGRRECQGGGKKPLKGSLVSPGNVVLYLVEARREDHIRYLL